MTSVPSIVIMNEFDHIPTHTQVSDEIIGVRHLEDYDRLVSCNRDSSLKPDQEVKAREICEGIITMCHEKGVKKTHIMSSTKKRALETVDLIIGSIPEDIKFEVEPDTRLRELDQGVIRFPEGFKDGDYFEPLKYAWDAYWEQTFTYKNLLYRFGDHCDKDGKLRYPALEGHFESFGENYAEFAFRQYDFLYSLSQKTEEYRDCLPVIVTHSATLSLIAEIIKITDELVHKIPQHVPLGELPQMTWENFPKIKDILPTQPEFGYLGMFDVRKVFQPEIAEIIAIERDVLQAKLMQAR
ncbi:MAG: hypothetical protein HZA80_02425 [Candidatus Taylorbacteria bacterium]|nr:hypothetical protein [Candidatus Taylorbacteria bacterium]